MEPATPDPPAEEAGPLRAFLQRSEHPHALVLTGVRTSTQGVAGELWAHAVERDRVLLTLGRRLLTAPRSDALGLPANSLLHLPDAVVGEAGFERRVAEAAAQARTRGYVGVTLLVAPGQHVAGGLVALDAALDAALPASPLERFCLYPLAWLRHQGPVDAVQLVRGHEDTLVLP